MGTRDFRVEMSAESLFVWLPPPGLRPPGHRECLHHSDRRSTVFNQLSGCRRTRGRTPVSEHLTISGTPVPSSGPLICLCRSIGKQARGWRLTPLCTSQPLCRGASRGHGCLCPASSGCGQRPERWKVNCFLVTDGSGVETKSEKRIMMLVIPTFFFLLENVIHQPEGNKTAS